MNRFIIAYITILLAFLFIHNSVIQGQKESVQQSVYKFIMKDIDGNDVSLEEFEGKVLLIVNVASKCGFTPQYEGLQSIYSKYEKQGFAVLGFPANDFGNQDPGSEQQIKQFCTMNFGVTFPMFSKISVKGEDRHPLYQYLTSKDMNPKFSGEITWNFNKFLVGKDGTVIDRFSSSDKPESKKVTSAIEDALQSS